MSKFLPLGLAIIVLFLNIVNASFSVLAKTSFEETYASRTTILNCERLLSNLKDVETGQRGYVLTEDINFLQPYNKSLPEIKILISDLESETDKIKNIKEETVALLSHLNKTIELAKQGKWDEAGSLENSIEGKKKMDTLRVLIADLEKKIYDGHIKERDKVINGFNWQIQLLYINTATAFILILLFLMRMVEWRHGVS